QIIDQYNQIYGQYVRMFDAYTQVTVANNKDIYAGIGDIRGGAYQPYQYIKDLYLFLEGAYGYPPLDTSPLAIPTAPGLGGSYYNIANGLGLSFNPTTTYTTATGADYASQWTAYFFNVMAVNGNANFLPLTSMPNLSNILAANAQTAGAFMFAAAPPSAPP